MSTHAQPSELPPPVAMPHMIQGFWVSRALYVAAKLGIPDLLKDDRRAARIWRRLPAPTLLRYTGCCEPWTVLGYSQKTIRDVLR